MMNNSTNRMNKDEPGYSKVSFKNVAIENK
jgi:hypothetical protein